MTITALIVWKCVLLLVGAVGLAFLAEGMFAGFPSADGSAEEEGADRALSMFVGLMLLAIVAVLALVTVGIKALF